jgi:hypothetical protein
MMEQRWLFTLLLCLRVVFCQRECFIRFDQVIVEFGKNIGSHVQDRILLYLESIPNIRVSEGDVSEEASLHHDTGSTTLLLSMGNAPLSQKMIAQSELVALPPESFQLHFVQLSSNTYALVSNGLPLDAETHRNVSFDKNRVHYGSVVGAYAVLEELGFAFMHPLEPTIPSQLHIEHPKCKVKWVRAVYAATHTRAPADTNLDSDTDAQQQLLASSLSDFSEIPLHRIKNNEESIGTSGSGSNRENNRNSNVATTTTPYIRYTRSESPHWPERGFHIHTQHPLELTEVLQGHDIPQFGPHGPACKRFTKLRPVHRQQQQRSRTMRRRRVSQAHTSADISTDTADAAGTGGGSGLGATTTSDKGGNKAAVFPTDSAAAAASTTAAAAAKKDQEQEQEQEQDEHYCERWEDMVSDVDHLFEWAAANRQNKVEWLLLGSSKWGDEWSTRRDRLRILTNLGHQYSLLVGADSPLGNIQQHGLYMVNVRLPFAQQAEQIRQRVDWVFKAGFDFLTTESGLSEFTHPECDHMVELMNVFASHVNVTWGREAAIKVSRAELS